MWERETRIGNILGILFISNIKILSPWSWINEQQRKVGLLVAPQSAFSVSCVCAFLVVRLWGTRKLWKAFCSLLLFNVEGSSSVLCYWLGILWSSCGLVWVGLVESSAGSFLFTELSAQADDAFQRKVPVFPYVTAYRTAIMSICNTVSSFWGQFVRWTIPAISFASKNKCVCCACDQH